MTHQSPIRYAPGHADAGGQLAQLRDLLGLVQQIAGLGDGADAALDESARLSGAYGGAQPIVQKRFDALAAETIEWAAVAVEALLECEDEAAARGASSALAADLSQALRQLADLLGAPPAPAAADVKLPSWVIR
jgi:hypothetical protein